MFEETYLEHRARYWQTVKSVDTVWWNTLIWALLVYEPKNMIDPPPSRQRNITGVSLILAGGAKLWWNISRAPIEILTNGKNRELIFRGFNIREFVIFENFAGFIFREFWNFGKLTKSFFVIFLFFVPFQKYFWEINNRINFHWINFRELAIFKNFAELIFANLRLKNSWKLIPQIFNSAKINPIKDLYVLYGAARSYEPNMQKHPGPPPLSP